MGLNYYHVSAAQFAPGDTLLPGDKTGIARTEGGSGDQEHVFLSKDPYGATQGWGHKFANDTGRDQHVYEVAPRGKPSHRDLDGSSPEYLAPSATVKRRVGTLSGDTQTWTYDTPEAEDFGTSPWTKGRARA